MTQYINALALAPDVNDWLANTRHPNILHVFDHACNLINERREVLSIVTPQIGNGPFNLVVEDEVVFSGHLSAESAIPNPTNQLHLGDLTVNTTNAKLWNPRPDWEMLHIKRDDILYQITSLRAPKPQTASGAKQSPTKSGIASSQKVSALLAMTDISYCQFSNSLAVADISTAIRLASQLAGLGQGLTPTGDDFIMGAIYAMWIIHPAEIASALAKEVAEISAPLTTSLSASWLRSAGKGDAGNLWHELFDALIAEENIQLPITNLLAVGETSGVDALAGFIGVCSAAKERIIDECPS